MSKSKKIADSILAEHPGENKVIITQDGQGFFSDFDANNHHNRNEFKENPEVFFREGFEPEDTKELEEVLQFTKEANATLGDAIKLVLQTTDLEADAPEVDGQTHEVVAKVVGLRENLETSKSTLKEVAEAITQVCDLENENPAVIVSDEASPIVNAVIELRTQLFAVSNELETLKAINVQVIGSDSKDVVKSATAAAKK